MSFLCGTISFFRPACSLLGFGDNIALRQLMEGLSQSGHKTTMSEELSDCIEADHIFLCNTYLDLNPKAQALSLINRSYSLIPFFEDNQFDHRNSQLFTKANFVIANSEREKGAILFHYPSANVHVIHWAPGQEFEMSEPFECPDSFILQVGRIEPRKNQLTTVSGNAREPPPSCSHLFLHLLTI